MTTTFSDQDTAFMRRALALAARARGRVEPNPMVGAVCVLNNKIVGEGYHHYFGGPHAEIHALFAARQKAKNATLYVTLEPCCHFGKTPPCTNAILHYGIKRVVVAMVDPFAKVQGKGIKLLKGAGVQVDVGLLEPDARALNAPFLTRLARHRPFVIAKWAQSLDGCVATASGESKWISSDTSRAFVQSLRGRMDGILVGINTALADDPLLTARPKSKAQLTRLATRIVLDSHCRLPPTSQLAKTVHEAPVLLAHARTLTRPAESRRKKLAAQGIMTLPLPTDRAGRPKLPALLQHLAHLEYTNLLLEGGPHLLASFLTQNLIDEAHIFIAPITIGGPNPKHAVGGSIDLKRLAQAPRLQLTDLKKSGPDAHLTLHRPTP